MGYSWQKIPLPPEILTFDGWTSGRSLPITPPKLELLMEDLRTSILRIPPPPVGTSHGRLRDFSSELPPPPPQKKQKKPGTSHEGLSDFISELTKNTPPKLEHLMEDLGTWL